MNNLTFSAAFVHKPSVYLETNAERTTYRLYITIQLRSGEDAAVSHQHEGDVLKSLLYTISANESLDHERILQETIQFEAEAGTVSDDPYIAVNLMARDGSKRKVIVHYADADIPGTGTPED